VDEIGPVKQVACGEAHTLAVSVDGKTVWSFGHGEYGRLGHGDSVRQTLPKVRTCTHSWLASYHVIIITIDHRVSAGNSLSESLCS
jgi:alpha-tubulin suppressor-like RCC1 family protein